MIEKVKVPRGVRDFLPEEIYLREYIKAIMINIFERHGFVPIDTPAMELKKVLSKKYGEEEKRIYNIERESKEDLALRFDLTVPLARYITMHRNDIILPFKRYHIDKVWRRERQQKGRYREFVQADIDIVGTNSMMADAEIIFIIVELFEKLGFEKFLVRINNRKILNGILKFADVPENAYVDVLRSIDKIEKIGIDGVESELSYKGLKEESAEKILELIDIKGSPTEIMEELEKLIGKISISKEGIEEIKEIINYLNIWGINQDLFNIDLSLARGLDYYTGPIFETAIEKPAIGSLTGGGRYANLIGMFSNTPIHATGTTIGFERVVEAFKEIKTIKFPKTKTKVIIVLIVFNNESKNYSHKILKKLLDEGIEAEIFMDETVNIRGQLGYANEKCIPWAIIVGPDEIKKNYVTLKNLRNSEQEKIDLSLLCEKIRESE